MDSKTKPVGAHVTITYFGEQMLGMSREWYYKHLNDPDLPQRVYIKGRAMLVTAECEAYVAAIHADRAPPAQKKNPPVRRVGRPRKITPPAV